MNDGFERLQKLGYSHGRIDVSLKTRWIGHEDAQPDNSLNLELWLSLDRRLAGLTGWRFDSIGVMLHFVACCSGGSSNKPCKPVP
jgi:hypothetical protein